MHAIATKLVIGALAMGVTVGSGVHGLQLRMKPLQNDQKPLQNDQVGFTQIFGSESELTDFGTKVSISSLNTVAVNSQPSCRVSCVHYYLVSSDRWQVDDLHCFQ
jgi:hypothetical protein